MEKERVTKKGVRKCDERRKEKRKRDEQSSHVLSPLFGYVSRMRFSL